MGKRSRARTGADRKQYSVEEHWTEADLARLAELDRLEALLPEDAPRALLSVRLSVLTEETTSPVRQELDLRAEAIIGRGCRVAGVARDLNVSATKVPPWKRRELGDWINNRVPEFDLIVFWKLDRFIRNLLDLTNMIEWCQKFGKNLVSKLDNIDLTTTIGKILVTIIGGIAEIEAANTSKRVASLWDYAKTQTEWLVGKPAYGYVTEEDESGKVVLRIDEDAYRVLHWCRRAVLRAKPASARRMVRVLIRSGMCGPGLTPSTLLRRLRNPAIKGHRVEVDKRDAKRRSVSILGKDGQPIIVAEPIFTDQEFDELQAALDRQGKNQPARQPGGATKLLGVLFCPDCMTNMIVQFTNNRHGTYKYLRCQGCKSGGLGFPDPDEVYARVVSDVLTVLGDEPVLVREYAQGSEAREKTKALKESITYYMKELEPGGRYRKTSFTKTQAESTLEGLINELAAVDPEATQDRWVTVADGKTYMQRWKESGMEAMQTDLNRVGIRCEVTRTKVKGVRAPAVHLRLLIPKDVRERLVVKPNHFDEKFGRR